LTLGENQEGDQVRNIIKDIAFPIKLETKLENKFPSNAVIDFGHLI
jgi:hypothetical protein